MVTGRGKLVLAIVVLVAACAPREDVATFTVERREFRHQVTAEGNLKAAKVTPVMVPQDADGRVRLAWLAPEGRVAEGEVIARFDGQDMVHRLRGGELDRKSAELQVGKARRQSDSKLAEFDTRLKVAESELRHAERYQKDNDQVFARSEIIEEEIDDKLAALRKEHAAASRQSEEVRGKTELEILEIRKKQAQQTIDQAKKGLSALEVTAPHSGLFTVGRMWGGEPIQPGQEMWRGQEIGEIPNLSLMEAEVYVLEADAGGLEIGKPATVVVEAFPERSFPATVSHVDAVAKPRFRGSPVQYFGVTLEFETSGDLPMKPGHRVQATLHLEHVDDALVVPRQAVFSEDNRHHVYVQNGAGYKRRTVEIGAKSMGLMVVEEGISEGEVVALREPSNVDEGEGDETAAIAQKPRVAQKP